MSLDEPNWTVTTKDQWALARGDQYRPLTPRERARGGRFSDDFELPGVSRVDQMRGLGNAVPPPLCAVIRTLAWSKHVSDPALRRCASRMAPAKR